MSSNQIRIITGTSYPVLPNIGTDSVITVSHTVDTSATSCVIPATAVIESSAPKKELVYKQIIFADNVSMIISKEWYDKYEKLQVPIILRNGTLFKNIIYPLLTGESLTYVKTGNPMDEFSQVIGEINYYGVPLTSKQMFDIASNCGLVTFIQTAKDYIHSKTNGVLNYHKGFKGRYEKFSADWKRLIDIYVERHPNDEMDELVAPIITEMLLSFDFQSIFVANMQKHNIIFEYVDWFTKVVQKKDHKSLSNYIEGLIVNKTASINSWVESQLMSLPIDETIKAKMAIIMKAGKIRGDTNSKTKV
jgi:hypothetical protein